MTGPVLRWALSLRRQLTIVRAANEALRRTNAVLSQRLEQARRDAELLALASKDRETSLAFLRDSHRIDGLDEPA